MFPRHRFVANMCVKQNAIDFASEYPLAAKTTEESFYVDDGLTGASDVSTAIQLQRELDDLFRRGGFILHKWNSNDPVYYSTLIQSYGMLGTLRK